MSIDPTFAHVRRLRAEDATAYRTLRLESLRHYPLAYGTSIEEEASRPLSDFADLLAQDAFNGVMGAFVEDTLSGIAGFYRDRRPRQSHKGYLCAMYVKDRFHGTSLAQELVHEVVSEATGQVELLQLCVTSSNERARRFYEKCGFVTYGREPKALQTAEGYLDLFLMWRAIAPPA